MHISDIYLHITVSLFMLETRVLDLDIFVLKINYCKTLINVYEFENYSLVFYTTKDNLATKGNWIF